MSKRNLTVQLDEGVIQQAKVLAAKRGTSVSGLVAKQLQELCAQETRYDEAWRRAADIVTGAVARGGRRWRREDLYAR